MEHYDSALLGILQNEGEIVKFLDVILGFLQRKTDFYKIMKSKEDKMGFSPGVARSLLVQEFDKFNAIEHRSHPLPKVQNDPSQDNQRLDKSNKGDYVDRKGIPTKPEIKNSMSQGVAATSASVKDNSNKGAPTNEKAPDSSTEHTDINSDKDTEETRRQKVFQENSESHNGAIRENYSWSQSIGDVDACIKVPEHIKKGKDVNVVIDRRHLKVTYPGEDGQPETVVDSDLQWEVVKEESFWSLVPGVHVHVNFEKKEERWWEALFVDEPKINVRKIDASRPMTDLDDEAQAKVAEMMYNEQRKRQGLPQSHEQKMHDMMKTAWEAEGSPFKGQPFDPSVLSYDSSGVVTVKPPDS